MPGPSSSTASVTLPREVDPVSRTIPPSEVYSIALRIRLRSAWARRSGSASTKPIGIGPSSKRGFAVGRAPSISAAAAVDHRGGERGQLDRALRQELALARRRERERVVAEPLHAQDLGA